MKVCQHIKNSKSPLFSFEIIPPLKGQGIEGLFKHIDPLMEFNPPFIDVTYHREEYVLRKRSGGGFDRVAVRKRPGTVGICAAIKHRYNVDPVPHIICGGFSKEETENALIDLHFLGIDNVLLLKGDALKNDGVYQQDTDGNQFASDLVEQVMSMNNGSYLDEDLENARPTDFCIGVAGYPEKHFAAPNLKTDLKYLKKKVELGAEYIVTQMFFDNKKFFSFVEECKNEGIDVPIIPGLKPITTKKQLNILPTIFNIDLPEELVSEVEKCNDSKEVKQVGIEWGINQSKELIEAGVPVLHYYSMGKSDSVHAIAKSIF
ncbi:MAG: methylenetetrahydrofolate reductase [NAD(P)H] [Bacteroidota bacterium]